MLHLGIELNDYYVEAMNDCMYASAWSHNDALDLMNALDGCAFE